MAEGFCVWITGMPRAGKTMLAKAVAERLRVLGKPVELLDGGELEDVLEGPGKERKARFRRGSFTRQHGKRVPGEAFGCGTRHGY